MAPVQGLGEATERPWKFEDGSYIVHGNKTIGQLWEASSFSPVAGTAVPTVEEMEANAALIVEAVNSFDALKQRVKVLEVGFQNVLNVLGPNVPSHLKGCPGCQEEWAEAIRIAREALDLQCGNCGDDGEEPSKNCPTCHGTGWRKSCKK